MALKFRVLGGKTEDVSTLSHKLSQVGQKNKPLPTAYKDNQPEERRGEEKKYQLKIILYKSTLSEVFTLSC